MAQGDAAGLAAYGMEPVTRYRWDGFWPGVFVGVWLAAIMSALIAVVVLG